MYTPYFIAQFTVYFTVCVTLALFFEVPSFFVSACIFINLFSNTRHARCSPDGGTVISVIGRFCHKNKKLSCRKETVRLLRGSVLGRRERDTACLRDPGAYDVITPLYTAFLQFHDQTQP